jgi:hypothetical protein
MNVNFGLFPPLAHSPSRGTDGTRLRGTAKAMAKRRALTARALADLDAWRDVGNHPPLQGEGRIAKGDPGWGEAAFVVPLSPPPPPGGGVRHSPPLRDGLALRGSGSNGDLVEPRPK